ncbi:3-dehydrosphinganine reductase [Thecaphora frezii]
MFPSTLSSSSQAFAAVVVLAISYALMRSVFPSSSSRWKPAGRNVLITGGSQGLGLALARLLVERGSNVVVCARTESKLTAAVESLKSLAVSPSQTISYVAADVSTFSGAQHVIRSCPVVPDTVFCCAGGAKPGFFLQQTEADFQEGIKTDYLTSLATAHAAANAMARAYPPHEQQKRKLTPKIVLVSSTLGFMALVGYSQYTPMKHAIRGLAESLRSELILYGIDVHSYFPANILSPGFEEENKTKPQITKDIEGDGSALTPGECAKRLIKGLQAGHFFITSDATTELFRTSALGSAPTNRGLLDRLTAIVAWIAIPIWRRFEADKAIKAHRAQHFKDLNLSP